MRSCDFNVGWNWSTPTISRASVRDWTLAALLRDQSIYHLASHLNFCRLCCSGTVSATTTQEKYWLKCWVHHVSLQIPWLLTLIPPITFVTNKWRKHYRYKQNVLALLWCSHKRNVSRDASYRIRDATVCKSTKKEENGPAWICTAIVNLDSL